MVIKQIYGSVTLEKMLRAWIRCSKSQDRRWIVILESKEKNLILVNKPTKPINRLQPDIFMIDEEEGFYEYNIVTVGPTRFI